ncbi:MAG TPA: hypothetical protein VFH87_13885, partial [Candidatus Udaeobacter sp.]|nr:hypothetical protein [Candidatus Udaeobacter sp.]
GLTTFGIVTVAFRNRSREGVLTQAGLDKTTECDRRERGSQSKTNFRMHARDEKKLPLAMQAFLLHFCNVSRSFATRLAYAVNGFSHWALDVERWALKVSR